MKKFAPRTAGVVALLALLTGCASDDFQACANERLSALVSMSEVTQAFDEIAAGFCPPSCTVDAATGVGNCGESDLSKLVLVPDYVSITNYLPGVSGLYMGEQMRAALSRRCHSRIYQAELGRDFKLSGDGLVALTRNPGEVVRSEFVDQDMLIGTYAYNGNRLSLFTRKIRGSSGIISKMISKEIIYSCGAMGTSAKIMH